MRWFQIFDSHTGLKHNALASDVAGAKRDQANVAARGLAGRRGTIVEGTRYSVEGETFDVAFHTEALQGAKPARTERKLSAAERATTSPYEEYEDRAAFFHEFGRYN